MQIDAELTGKVMPPRTQVPRRPGIASPGLPCLSDLTQGKQDPSPPIPSPRSFSHSTDTDHQVSLTRTGLAGQRI